MKHYVNNYILNPQHRLTVDLIGAGGTGSQMLQSLARMDYALYKLGHPGLFVKVYDDDIVTEANIGRQLFSGKDVGRNKAEVLVTRANTFFGLDWESKPYTYPNIKEDGNTANITITCVDSAVARIEIGKFLHKMAKSRSEDTEKPLYWLDFGNQKDRGQVVLGTLQDANQPRKRKDVCGHLDCVDEMFDLSLVDEKASGPSCSLAEALRKQDLFINSTLCQLGSALMWKTFQGVIDVQGAYLNLDTMKVNPIKIVKC